MEATEVYFVLLATILGRYAFEGGERRQLRQQLQRELGTALARWMEKHPSLRPALKERLMVLHEDFFRNVDSCRDHFEQMDP